MKALYELKELLCDQIEEIVEKHDITPTELDHVYKVVDVIKDIDTIEAMQEYGDDYSEDYPRYSYRRGRYYRDGRRGRDGDERYSERYPRMYRDDHYSGHTKEQMLQKIAEMQREVEQM